MTNLSEEKQYIEYIDNMVKALEVLIDDKGKIGNFPINMNRCRRKLLSSNIVCDCLYFKTLEPPKKLEKIQKEINRACDFYLDFYSQVCERIIDNDLIWIKRFNSNVLRANRIVVKALEVLLKIRGKYTSH